MSQSDNETKKSLPKIIKIALVDDQQLFRDGIKSLLKDYYNIQVILEAANGEEMFQQIRRQGIPHVILLDIEMPIMNGVEATLKLKKKYPEIKVLILTVYDDEEFIFDLMSKGAHGYLKKDLAVEEVIKAIYGVMEKGEYYSEKVATVMVKGSQGLVKHAELNKLTDKEIEVIKLICKQHTNKEIGDILGVSYRTVETHKTNIFVKTNTKNSAGIVLYALKHKLINKLEML